MSQFDHTPSLHDEGFSLSFSQQRLWLFEQLNPSSQAYHLGGLIWFNGELDVSLLEQAINELLSGHDVFRTHLVEGEAGVKQQIRDYQWLALPLQDVTSEADAMAAARQHAKQIWRKPYDLNQGPLTRVKCFKVGPQQYGLLLACHHMVMDAWSLQLVMKYLVQSQTGKNKPWRSKQNYQEFVAAQASYLKSAAAEEDLAELARLLPRQLPELGLPRLSQENRDSYPANQFEARLSKQLDQQLNAAGKAMNCSKFALLSLSLQLALAHHSGTDCAAITVPSLNRNAKTRRALGFFVNNILSSTEFDWSQSFAHHLTQNQAQFKAALKLQHVPLEQAKQALSKVAFNFRSHGDGNQIQDDSLSVAFEEFEVAETPFEMVLDVISGEQVSLRWVYANSLFSDDTMKRFHQQFLTLLGHICQAPEQPLHQILVLLGKKSPGLIPVNTDYSAAELFSDLVDQQAAQRPEAIALVHGKRRV
ncbi:condensation domain-containing protein, partial [Motilimonas pumila]